MRNHSAGRPSFCHFCTRYLSAGTPSRVNFNGTNGRVLYRAFLSFKNFHAEGLRLLSTPFVEKDSPQIIWKSAIVDWEEKVSTASLRIIQNDNSDEARKADQARLQRIV
jgi:hypothetical protein